jgi:hypothetical protein
MSGRAFGWAKKQDAPDRDTKALLVFLADYVQDTPFAWPAVATVAAELQCSERTVQRMLPQLVAAGLIVGYEVKDKATGRCRTRAYYFPIEADEPTPSQLRAFEMNAGCTLTRLGGEGDSTVTPEGDAGVTGEGDSSVTGRVSAVSPLNEPSSELSDADASSTGGRAREGESFEDAWAAYPEAGRLGVSSERLARQAFADELAGGAAPARIVAGARGYAATPKVWGASGRPKALHRFLSEGIWEGFADGAASSQANGVRVGGWAGPDDVRAAVATVDPALVVSCLDMATWDGVAIVARTRWAADKLRAMRLPFDVKDPPPG